MTAVASAINSRPSVQWCITVTVHVCLRYRNPRTSEYAEKKRREHNLIYAAVNLKRECLIIDYRSRRIVLLKLKLTTDRHEASRGLSAIAGLLVFNIAILILNWWYFVIVVNTDRQNIRRILLLTSWLVHTFSSLVPLLFADSTPWTTSSYY